MTPEQLTPAKFLEGMILAEGWIVEKPRGKHPDGSGGNFSYSYEVKNQATGQRAFLKALDFSMALKQLDPIKAIARLTGLFDFEQNVLELCRNKRLSRIISLIETGNIPPAKGGVIPVPYFIMELAHGDIYNQLDFSKEIDSLMSLKIIHNLSAALYQLHNNGISHQDVKPSNILILETGPHKLGDLGRADIRGQATPYSILHYAGDPSYAPPEAQYKAVQNDWVFKRIACDAYQFGSMIVFLFTQLNMTALLKMHLSPEHNWNNWTQTYREVLPYLYVSLDRSVEYFRNQIEDKDLAEELSEIIFQLCDPDPIKRGHPKTLNSRFKTISLERYITKFDKLIKKQEIKMSKKII